MFLHKGDMTTITSHSLPLIPLRQNLTSIFGGKRTNDEICPTNGANQLPRSLIHLSPPLAKVEQMSPQDCYASENSQSNSICDMDHRSSVGPIDSKLIANGLHAHDDAGSEHRSSSVLSSYKSDGFNRDQDGNDDDDDMNYCSDDSELSVGKEVDDNEAGTGFSIESDRRKSICGDIKSTSFRVDDSIAFQRTDRLMAATRYHTKLPNIIRPSPTRFQEEFLRKSHLYAEEIMKHQINFMTVTKGLNISQPKIGDNTTFNYPVRPNALSPIHVAAAVANPKIGFSRLHPCDSNDLSKKWSIIDDRNSQSPPDGGTNFREIHSHLNAISKITSALGRDRDTSIHLTSPGCTTSRESSQSPPTQHPHHHHRHFQRMLHNNFNETNLKFSIDNILKPSFGRRITDPLQKRNKNQRKGNVQQMTAAKNNESLRSTSNIEMTTNALLSGNTTAIPSETGPKLTSTAATAAAVTTNVEQQDKPNQTTSASSSTTGSNGPIAWPAWVYCTRYSDRPSSGRSPRARRPKKPSSEKSAANDEKRPRTAFSGPQLARLKNEFAENRYLTERRRQQLSSELGLNEAQIKIWFQNKRAKIKKSSGQKNPLALQLMAQGLYNHSTVPLTREEEEMQERAIAEAAAAAADAEDDDDDDDD